MLWAFLALIVLEWRRDIADFWYDRLRLPTFDECQQDLVCPDCGKQLFKCRCGGGE